MNNKCSVMANKIARAIARQGDANYKHRKRKRIPVSVTLDPVLLQYFDKLVGPGLLFKTRSEVIELTMWMAKKEFDKQRGSWWWRGAVQEGKDKGPE
jgi:hypothetical protein